MIDGITIKILGDYGPFSRTGKSIGYYLIIGKSTYLIDCGAPPFLEFEGHHIGGIDSLIVTHSHDDHKRWFTDLALYHLYEADVPKKMVLLTSEEIRDEIIESSGPALNRSLSNDSKNVIDIASEDYFDYQNLGPRQKYRIVSRDEGNGKTTLCVTDRNNNVLSPDMAKIVISQKTKRPRMLFKDPYYKEWVEPECFYPFSSNVFYEEDKNIYRDKEGFSLEAIKAPVWHGITGIGIKIRTDKETLILSSDTAHDKNLWNQLCKEKRKQRLPMSQKEFESASVFYGDINDYIERIWSEERYREASNAFNDAIVIHDIASDNSIVHTDYMSLKNTFLSKEKTLLTHSPDITTSDWVLCGIGKTYKIMENRFFEEVGDKLYPMNADIYHRDGEKYYVGYKNEKGRFMVYEQNGLLKLSEHEGQNNGKPLYRVDLYEDISGKYFPYIGDKDHKYKYMERDDAKIELIEFSDEGSKGKIVENLRDNLMRGTKVAEEDRPLSVKNSFDPFK